MKEKFLKAMESFAKAMVQPLMYLSVGGMVLAVGSLLTNSTLIKYLPFLNWAPIQILGQLMYHVPHVHHGYHQQSVSVVCRRHSGGPGEKR